MKTYKGRGIVLHTLKYGDSSMVVYLLTDVGGRRSYMVQGVRSRSGRGSKSRLLGFRPGNDYTPGAWFDIREGLYSVVRPAHPGVMTQECASLLDRMLSCDVRRLGDVGLNRDRRSEFLNAMLAYFGYHLDAISAVQSVRILKEVF